MAKNMYQKRKERKENRENGANNNIEGFNKNIINWYNLINVNCSKTLANARFS